MRAFGIGLGCLLLLGAGSCGVWEEDPETPPLTIEGARVLVSEAAATSPEALNQVVELGATRSLKSVEDEHGVPLTLAVLGSPIGPRLHETDFRIGAATPADYARAIGRDKAARPSVIQVDYITSLSFSKTRDDVASGVVRFEAPGVYTGRARFLAVVIDGAWTVTEFVFPKSDVRVALEGGRWRLHAPGWTAAAQPPTGIDLPKVTEVGLEPPAEEGVVIRLTRDGVLTVGASREPLGRDGLHESLVRIRRERGPRLIEPDGSSRLHAILEVDETVPWQFTQWVMQACAHPDVRIYKLFFRALAGAEAGAIGATLPKDRGLAPTPRAREFVKHKVVMFKTSREPSHLRALWAALLQIAEADRAESVFEIVAPPPKGGAVPHGFVVQIVDLVRRAGGKTILFEGAATPLGKETGSAEWLAGEVRRVAAREGNAFIKLDRKAIGPAAEGAPALPRGGRVDRILVLDASTFAEEIVEDLEEIPEEVIEEKPVEVPEPVPPPPLEEPVIEDEEIEDPEAPPGAGGAASLPRGFKKRGEPRRSEDSSLRLRAAAAVEKGLRWLAAHQAPDGSWQAADFGRWCDGKLIGDDKKVPDGAGKALYDVGVTGLALNAFLGAGYTNRGRHPFAKVVSRGLRFLKNVQDPEGCFGPRSTQQYIYNHAIAALAMVEVFGMTGSPIFKGSAQRALDFVGLARNPYFAWRYGIKPGDNDTSVSVWMLSVLASAKMVNEDAVKRGRPAPLSIDEGAFEGVRSWLEKVTDPKTGRCGYVTRGTGPARPQELVDNFPGDLSRSMTAAALWARVLTGEDPRRSDVMKKGLAQLAELPPAWEPKSGRVDMYYWYYGTLATYQAGGGHWRAWEVALGEALLPNQRTDGDACTYRGSWDPVGPWQKDGGRVYSTAMMTLCLQAWYRYKRLFGR